MTLIPLDVLPTRATPDTTPRSSTVPTALTDAHGRVIRDLRLSVTDRCNFRCTYCMEPDTRFMPKTELLTLPEYLRLVSICRDLGIEKVRLTGGEPTLYPELDALIEHLGKMEFDDLAMTTNGWRLEPDRAHRWRDSGLSRLTFSLDTLRQDRFAQITRSKFALTDVLDSIEVARSAGLGPIKVNAVIMRGVNDDEVASFGAFAREREISMRLIEFMPLDAGHAWDRHTVVTMADMLKTLQASFDLVEIEGNNPHSTSMNFKFADGGPGSIGIIAPVSRPFCGACNRLRITAEGKVRPCLFSHREWNLKPLLRQQASDAAIASFMADGVWRKQAGHQIGSAEFQQPERTMSAIGG